MDDKKPSVSEKLRQTQLFKSVFRHGFEDTFRNRVLKVMSNVFLHLHPAKISLHGLKIQYT